MEVESAFFQSRGTWGRGGVCRARQPAQKHTGAPGGPVPLELVVSAAAGPGPVKGPGPRAPPRLPVPPGLGRLRTLSPGLSRA
jgi:hypothetical protein